MMKTDHESAAFDTISTWLGELLVVYTEHGLRFVRLPDPTLSPKARAADLLPNANWVSQLPAMPRVKEQMAAYFAGELTDFDVPVDLRVTPFQECALMEVARIPFGQTASYGDIARRIGVPSAARAVGMANHHNPVPIVIPCHRVVRTGGKPGGYAGGVEMKKQLLEFEAHAAG